MSVEIEIGQDGMPNYKLSDEAFVGLGQRIGYGNGPRPMVKFHPVAKQHAAASLAESRPVHRTIVHMRLQHPGERDVIDRPATRADAERFPAEYRAYCQGRVARPDGTPLEVIFPHHADVVMMLGAHGVYTVEQLADLTDTQKQNLGMGGHEWSGRARQYLKHLQDGKGFAQMQEQIKRGDVERERLNGQNAQLVQQVQALTMQVQDLMRSLTAAGHMPALPGTVHQMQMPVAPPPAPYLMQPNGVAAPAPGELGADEIPMDMQIAAAGGAVGAFSGDDFLEDIAAQAEAARGDELRASPADQPRRSKKGN